MLRNIKYLLISALFAVNAYAQPMPIQNEAGATLRDLNSELRVGRNFSVRKSGDTIIYNRTTAASFTPNSLAFGSVSTSYATIVTNSQTLKYLDCWNGLDVEVRLSHNATTDTLGAIGAGSGKLIPLYSLGLYITSNISVKSISSPTSGNITCTVGY